MKNPARKRISPRVLESALSGVFSVAPSYIFFLLLFVTFFVDWLNIYTIETSRNVPLP